MKWAFCGGFPEEKLRFELLAKALGEAEPPLQIEWKEDTDWSLAFEPFNHVRIGDQLQVKFAKLWAQHSSMTSMFGVTDGFIRQGNKWWPKCSSFDAICSSLKECGDDLDFSMPAFVSGAGATARVGIAALFRCGFRKFKIAAESVSVESLVSELKGRFFGCEFEIIPFEKIVMLAGECSLFLNTVRQSEDEELTRELSYLNFLRRPSLIVDTTLLSQESVFVKEAEESGIRGIDGWTIAAHADALWAEWAWNKSLDPNDLLTQFRQGLPGLSKNPTL